MELVGVIADSRTYRQGTDNSLLQWSEAGDEEQRRA